MDRVALEILGRELEADAAILADAVRKAADRLAAAWPGHLEACAFELHRLCNVIEKSLERICIGFENHFEKRGDHHGRLLDRMVLELPGIRPRFLTEPDRNLLRELKAFRHLFRHAYDLTLQPKKVIPLVAAASQAAHGFPLWTTRFLEVCRAGLTTEED